MFEKEKPYILGGIFDILSKAIGLYDTITVRKSHRLADFHKFGCAIAKAMYLRRHFTFSLIVLRPLPTHGCRQSRVSGLFNLGI